VIVAKLHPVDRKDDIDTSAHVHLCGEPFPGDIVITAAGERVRVIRREFIDHGQDKNERYVDLILDVRLVAHYDG